jgi:hypothetical protein
MRLQTYEALKKIVPPYEGEMLIDYFERVSETIARRLDK